jgi:hypothetical protein
MELPMVFLQLMNIPYVAYEYVFREVQLARRVPCRFHDSAVSLG